MGSTVATSPNRGLSRGLGVFQTLIGLSAVAGGVGLAMDPTGASLGMSTAWLDGSPFPNFLIPGLFLLSVNGIGTLAGALLTLRAYRYAGEVAALLGVVMMGWITIQVLVISGGAGISWLQPFYFVVGLVELGLGLLLRQRMRQRT